MTPDRWQQIDRLLELALEQEPGERADFLNKTCASDDELRREVEALLAAHDQAGHFMEKPALDARSQAWEQKQNLSLVGRTLGPYEILSLLGGGGMGEVYRARDTRLERIAALKILPSEVATDPDRLRRFVREAKAASALNHPNIATIYEIGELDNIHWIAMELVEGETLAERLNREVLEVTDILEIGIQAAEALEEAHSKGITHRDIKPANLMLTPKGKVKVLDFGLAKITREKGSATGTASSETHTFPGLVMGTARYMSPEQVLGQEVDHRTDLFSLGVVLYEVVTGTQAFSGQTSTAVFDAILHQAPTSPVQLNPKCPGELERIVNKALEKDRTLRYQSALELGADLKRLRRDRDTDRLAAAVSKPKPRRSLLWGTTLLLAAITGAASFWFFQFRKGTSEEPLVPIPFTTYPGTEYAPSFSPDGNQVAFTWNGEKQDNFDIYIKQIGSESLRRLTTDAHVDLDPAWSPDGQSIAFERDLDADKAAVMLIPANGGRERQVVEFRAIHGVCWHPGGKWLAVAGEKGSADARSAIYLLSPETGERRRLTSSPWGNDRDPTFSPDGRTLAFVQAMGGAGDIYLLRVSANLLPEGEPKQITFVDQHVGLPAWTPDGKEIIYSSGSHTHDWILWRISASGSGKPKPLPFSGEGMALHAAMSLKGHRLVYQVMFRDVNIWRYQIPQGEDKPAPPSRLIASTHVQEGAQYSPDGKSVAFVAWASGSGEIWVCDADGRNPLQLTHLGGHAPGIPHWSPDGRNIVFSMTQGGQSHPYMIPAQGGQIKQLSLSFSEYSRDGKWIYFESDRGGASQIWKRPLEGGETVQVTQKGGSHPLESTDGKTLFYLRPKDSGFDELWKVPVDGGEESRVVEEIHYGNYDVRDHGIYFVSEPHQDEIRFLYYFLFYDFADGKTRRIATIRDNSVEWGFTVSPDEHWILCTQGSGEQRSDLMLVENFH